MGVLRTAIVCLAIAAASCGAGPTADSATVAMGEYTIDPSASQFIEGEITLELVNEGELPHTLVVSRRSGEVLAASDVLQAGESTVMNIELDAGDYEFTCRIVAEFDGELLDHYELGMVTSIGVEG